MLNFKKSVLSAWMFFFILFSGAANSEIDYQIKAFTCCARHLMHNDGGSALYRIYLRDVDHFLPTKLAIQKKFTKLISRRLIPGKTLYRVSYKAYLRKTSELMQKGVKDFFAGLETGSSYTYVILNDRMNFTKTISDGNKQFFVDLFSKHYFISRLNKSVRFAGEFRVHRYNDGDIAIVFNNASGTYRPSEGSLTDLLALLNHNFAADGLRVAVRSYQEEKDQP